MASISHNKPKHIMHHHFINKLLFCVSILFLLPFFTIAQDDEAIPSKKLLKDFDTLKEMIGAHPDPYTHISESDFNKTIAAIESSLNEPHTVLEFYKKTASLVALIKDGHSQVVLPKDWLLEQREAFGLFPYEVFLTNDDQLYVVNNLTNETIPVGAQILSINGISVPKFLEIIDPYISYERKNFRNTIIDSAFEKYLYLAFGFSENTVLEYFSADTVSINVENIPKKEWKQLRKEQFKERKENRSVKKSTDSFESNYSTASNNIDPYAYNKVSEGVGMISIFSFSVPDLQSYKIFLNKTFREIRNDKIHSLIIDVRGNFGGWPKVSSCLFHYISDTYFKTMAKSTMKVSNPYKNYVFDRWPSLRTNRQNIPTRNHYVDFNSIISKKAGAYVEEEAFFNEKPITEKYEFKGDCYLLINRDSYSASSSFASTFQCYQMGVIIGEETGGTKIFRANAISKLLNKSGLAVGISTTKLYTTCFDKEMEAIQPTAKYEPSILEILSDMDTQLLYTQRLIRQIQRKKKE